MSTFKKQCWTQADVGCPFYISDDRMGCSVSCESYSGGGRVVTRFMSLAEREKHMGRFCVESYRLCPMYRCIYEAKYNER